MLYKRISADFGTDTTNSIGTIVEQQQFLHWLLALDSQNLPTPLDVFRVSLAHYNVRPDSMVFLSDDGLIYSKSITRSLVEMGRVDLIKLLNDSLGPLDFALLGSDGCSPLHMAAYQGDLEMVEYMASRCIVCGKGKGNMTAFMFAASQGHTDVMRYLYSKDHYCYFDKTTLEATPLELAALGGHVDAVEFLIGVGANVNARSWRGTVLHSVSYKLKDNPSSEEYKTIWTLLISSGADPQLLNVWGNPPDEHLKTPGTHDASRDVRPSSAPSGFPPSMMSGAHDPSPMTGARGMEESVALPGMTGVDPSPGISQMPIRRVNLGESDVDSDPIHELGQRKQSKKCSIM